MSCTFNLTHFICSEQRKQTRKTERDIVMAVKLNLSKSKEVRENAITHLSSSPSLNSAKDCSHAPQLLGYFPVQGQSYHE